jgi:hypothetical protein
MHLMPEVAAQQRMVDNGSGDVEVSGISIAFIVYNVLFLYIQI